MPGAFCDTHAYGEGKVPVINVEGFLRHPLAKPLAHVEARVGACFRKNDEELFTAVACSKVGES